MPDVQVETTKVTNSQLVPELNAAKLRLLKLISSNDSNLRQIEIAAQAFALLNGTLTSATSSPKS
jgi:hypothetical protein